MGIGSLRRYHGTSTTTPADAPEPTAEPTAVEAAIEAFNAALDEAAAATKAIVAAPDDADATARLEAAQVAVGEAEEAVRVARELEAAAVPPAADIAPDVVGTPDPKPSADETPQDAVEAPAADWPDEVAENATSDAPAPEKPKGNASLAEWTAYALANGYTTEDLADSSRDQVAALFKD